MNPGSIVPRESVPTCIMWMYFLMLTAVAAVAKMRRLRVEDLRVASPLCDVAVDGKLLPIVFNWKKSAAFNSARLSHDVGCPVELLGETGHRWPGVPHPPERRA